MIEEVKSLEGNIFVLNDDNLAQRNNYYKELFRRLIPLKKKWVGEASWNITQDGETLDLLEKSGCKGLAIGFESLEPQRNVKKIVPSRDVSLLFRETVKKIQKHNMAVMGNFIFGFDNESEASFEKTLEFILDSHMDIVQLGVLKPFPGSPLYDRLEKEGRITERNWNNYRGMNICFKLKNMSRKTFLGRYYWITREVNSYRRIALRMMRAARRLSLYEWGILFAVNLGFRNSIKKCSLAIRDSQPGILERA